jgi:short-subunit dehydrogenase
MCPGTTESAFHERTGMADSKLIKKKNMMDAQTVAEIGYRGLMKGKTIVIPGLENKIMAKIVRFIPRSLVTKIVRKMQENN